MPTFNVLISLGLTVSVVVCLITWNRIFAYNDRYSLPESKYTKLFKVFTKEHIAMAYTFTVLLHVIITLWFLWDL